MTAEKRKPMGAGTDPLVAFRLPTEDKVALTAAATATGKTVSNLIREALASHPAVKAERKTVAA